MWYELHHVAADVAPRGIGDEAEQLTAALARGDTEALAAAYREHHVVVRAFARRLLGDDVAAEDLVQEAFVALPAAARRFEGRSSFRSFVIAVVVNHSRHFVRAAARRRRAMDRLSVEPPATVAPPDENIAQSQLAAALFRGLDELPLDQRVAFVLCVIEERPSHEAAEIVGAPPPTIRARVQAAKLRLRRHLNEGGFR
jgi:RNA polymerase sigma-70 factor (ECF subfamily)